MSDKENHFHCLPVVKYILRLGAGRAYITGKAKTGRRLERAHYAISI
jgi:hypothetical protein